MILKKPLVTEKMTALMDSQEQYGFVVDKKATKPEIKKAVEEFLFCRSCFSKHNDSEGGSLDVIERLARSPVIPTRIKRPSLS